MSAGNILITQGTQSNVPVDTIGTVNFPVMKRDLGLYGVSSLAAPFGTTLYTTANSLGTIKPAVAGSSIYVTDIIISCGSATTISIGMGGTTTPLIGTMSFAANGGLAMPFMTPGSVTSGSALVYQQTTSGGPLSITVNGFVG